jgi:hypothetical protein
MPAMIISLREISKAFNVQILHIHFIAVPDHALLPSSISKNLIRIFWNHTFQETEQKR